MCPTTSSLMITIKRFDNVSLCSSHKSSFTCINKVNVLDAFKNANFNFKLKTCKYKGTLSIYIFKQTMQTVCLLKLCFYL